MCCTARMFWTEGIKRDQRGKEEYGLVGIVGSRLVDRTRVENLGTWQTVGIKN